MEQKEPLKYDRKIWQENNKDKIALAGRRYYEKMKNDPDFMEKKRKRAKERREKMKLLKPLKETPETNTKSEKNPPGRPRKY